MNPTHEYYTVSEASELTGLSKHNIRFYCHKGLFPGAAMFKGGWLIKAKALLRFCGKAANIQIKAAMLAMTEKHPEYKISNACRKLELIQKHQRLKTQYSRQIGNMSDAHEMACQDCNVPVRTMERWLSKYDRYGLQGLIDSRGKSEHQDVKRERQKKPV